MSARPHYLDNHPVSRSESCLERFISQSKKLLSSVFPGADWEAHRWDITEAPTTRINPGKRRQKSYLLFTEHSGKGAKASSSRGEEVPFTTQWGDLVKAYTVERAHSRSVSKDHHMLHIGGWRWLFSASADIEHDPARLTHRHFVDAANAFAERNDSPGSRSNVGKALVSISKLLDRRRLTLVRIGLNKNPFPRPKNAGGAKHRKVKGSKEAELTTKLPTQEDILALARLANMVLEPVEEMVIRGCEILLSVGFRANELLELPEDCLHEEQTINFETGEPESFYFIGYRARKLGSWRGRPIPNAAVPLVKRAINRLRQLSAEARKHRAFLEGSGFSKLLAFEGHCPDDEIRTSEVRDLLSMEGNTGHVSRFLKQHGILPSRMESASDAGAKPLKGRPGFLWRVGDIQSGLIASEVDKGPLVDRDGITIPLSKALFLVPQNSTHASRPLSVHDFNVLQQQQVDDVLVGRRTLEDEFPSIFDKYGLKGPAGQTLRLNTHQPRHWLNTLAQEGRKLTQLEIQAFFGRKYVKDNESYDHSGEPIPGEVIAQRMMDEHRLTRDNIEQFARTFPLLDFDAAVQMAKEDIGSVHITDVGMCFSDYAQSPCPNHLQCLRECSRYERQKGNAKEIEAITKIRDRTEIALAGARRAIGEEYYGANEWVKHHEAILSGCAAALNVEKLNVPDGTIVVVFSRKEPA